MKSALMFLLLLVTVPHLLRQTSPRHTNSANRPRRLDCCISALESELVPLAEAMPEEKSTFAPTQGEFSGVRDFGAQGAPRRRY